MMPNSLTPMMFMLMLMLMPMLFGNASCGTVVTSPSLRSAPSEVCHNVLFHDAYQTMSSIVSDRRNDNVLTTSASQPSLPTS